MSRATEELEVATVLEQDQGRVSISVPLVGFPDGFRLQPGDQVMIVVDDSGLFAKPLVYAEELSVVGDESPDDLLSARAAGYALQPGSIRAEVVSSDRRGGAAAEKMVVWTVESRATDRPRNVVATRTYRR